MSRPPEVSTAWTDAERLSVIEWICHITLDRIGRDDPMMPMLAKAPVCELFRAVQFLSREPADVLEQHRAILLKPYDAARDFYGVLVAGDAGRLP